MNADVFVFAATSAGAGVDAPGSNRMACGSCHGLMSGARTEWGANDA